MIVVSGLCSGSFFRVNDFLIWLSVTSPSLLLKFDQHSATHKIVIIKKKGRNSGKWEVLFHLLVLSLVKILTRTTEVSFLSVI